MNLSEEVFWCFFFFLSFLHSGYISDLFSEVVFIMRIQMIALVKKLSVGIVIFILITNKFLSYYALGTKYVPLRY